MRAALACALALTTVLLARVAAAEAASGSARSWSQSPWLLGDPGGWRSRLEDAGLLLEGFFNHFLGSNPQGGRTNRAPRQSGSFDFFAVADLDRVAGVPDGLALLHTKSTYNRNVNPDVRALSDPVDDADFDEPLYVAELWAQGGFPFALARLRAGYLDQQTAFDRNAYANSEDKQFSNSFLDNDPLVPLVVGLGATLFANPLDWLELAVGIADADNQPREAGFDTAFDGVVSLTRYFEAGLRVGPEGPRGRLPGHYRLGVFYDASKRRVFGSRDALGRVERERGHLGAYLSFDQLVFRERPGDEQGLGLFARYGYADEDVNAVSHFWSVGAQYHGALPGRDRDLLGLALYQTVPSDHFRDAVDPDFERETGVELYYRVQLMPWLAITPDFQFIHQPGGSDRARDALVFLLRLRVVL